MTLLLDIDGVLLWWNNYGPNRTGFDDFVNPHKTYFSRYSPKQLKLIADSFEDIRWHTTWIAKNMVNTLWTPVTGFGPYPIAIHALERGTSYFNVCSSQDDYFIDDSWVSERDISEPLLRANWWKLNAVAALLHHGHLPDKVVWVDDDIPALKGHIYTILDHFDVTDRFRLIAPTQIWSKTDIEEAAEWVRES